MACANAQSTPNAVPALVVGISGNLLTIDR
jgi:hypothetical protein